MVVTNYNGEVIEWTGTRYEALDKGYNVDCSYCSGCSGCSDCSGCSGCSRCSYCSGCSGCSRCSYCSYCSDCSGCSGCSRCSYCSGCSDCSRCSYCSGCSRCSYCSGCSGQPIATVVTNLWTICIRQDGTMKIGCQEHPLVQWLAFTDEQISRMNASALSFWKTWKPVVENLHKVHFNESTTTQ